MPRLTAAELFVQLSDVHGKPIEDAVVSVTPQSAGQPISPRPASVTRYIDQKNETFVPYLQVFRPGDRLVFRNSDPTRHHVYSFAPAKSFEFVLTSGESSTPLILDKLGAVAVGCNIHDSMIAYLYISDAPWIGRSGADGRVRLEGLPAGVYAINVWHPQLRPGKVQAPQQITIDPVVTAVNAAFVLSLLPDPRRPADRERLDY
ncbi:MAG: methylamine utilization protein [Tahibacter sp.]